MEFSPVPVEPLSYREYVDQYGGGLKEFSVQSLAYLLQQRREGLDLETIVKWESQLMNTKYDANANEQLTLGDV